AAAPRAEASARVPPPEPTTEPASQPVSQPAAQPDPASQPSSAPQTVAPPAAREAPPAAAATPGPVVPPALPDAWTGDALRQVREARGITIQQICERTKITRHHIENIESDRFDVLPAQVYLRGILLTIARELRLDGQKVARSYLERLGGAAPAGAAPRPR
ncbi:MAG TPA: helix-turn-helix transcriptional regulator, partial [Anaeromyxobacter sp.]